MKRIALALAALLGLTFLARADFSGPSVQPLTCSTHQWINVISAGLIPACTQPAAADLSNGTTGSGGGVVLATAPTISGLLWTGDTTSGTSAPAGNVGQVISATALTGAIVNNTVTNLASASITAGHWECFSSIYTHPAGTTTTAVSFVGINTNSTPTLTASFPTTGTVTATSAGTATGFTTGPQIYNFTSPTTVFVVGYVVYAVSTLTIDSQLTCKRIW